MLVNCTSGTRTKKMRLFSFRCRLALINSSCPPNANYVTCSGVVVTPEIRLKTDIPLKIFSARRATVYTVDILISGLTCILFALWCNEGIRVHDKIFKTASIYDTPE